MIRLTKPILVLTTLVLLGIAAAAVDAATVTVGAGDSGSRYPFGFDASAQSEFPNFVAGGIYQQVYASNSFPEHMTITHLAFASNAAQTSGPGTVTFNVTIALGRTGAAPNALSTDLQANRSGNLVQVFTGQVTATITGNDQADLFIDIAPFNYDSASGNLLLEITFNTPVEFTGGSSLFFHAGSSPSTSRAANPTGAAGGAFVDGFALETHFLTSSPTAASVIVSGQVSDQNGTALPGVAMRLMGGTSSTAITDATGNFRFANVEPNNFYTLTPELANYHFLPASRSFSTIGSESNAVFTGVPDVVASTNPIDSNEYFVRQQYLDFLDREPDRQGLEYWSGQLNQCNDDAVCLRQRRIDVSAAFFQSLEFQQTGSYIYRLYVGSLGRQPRYAEFVVDRRRVIGNANLDADKVAFTREFVTQTEFVEKYQANTSAESFVDALLQTQVIATTVNLTSEREELIRRYNSGHTLGESRARVLFNVAESPAFVTTVYNPAFVQMEYFGYLRREIDVSGYLFWIRILITRDPGNYRGMVCSFITSEEYQRRFSTVVTRSNADCGR